MSQKNGVSWRVVVLTLITVSLFLVSGTAEAKNPDISYWTQNLSESAAPTELGEYDFAQEIEVVGSTVHVMWLTLEKPTGRDTRFTTAAPPTTARPGKPNNCCLPIMTWYRQYLQADGGDGQYRPHRGELQGGEGGGWYGVLGYLRSTDNGASFEPIRVLFTSDSDATIAFMTYGLRPATVR